MSTPNGRRRCLLSFGALALVAMSAPVRADMSDPYVKHVRTFIELRQANVVLQEWDLSCGAASLATLLTYQHGDAVPEKEIALAMLKATEADLVRQRLGFSLLDLKRYVGKRGYVGEGYGEVAVTDLVELAPAIVPIRIQAAYDHFVVFRGLSNGRAVLADSAFGNRTMPIGAFLDVWRGRVAFVVRRPDDPQRQQNLLALHDDELLIVPPAMVRAVMH